MPEPIRIANYITRPLETVEFPDGSVWKLRQPLEEDYYRRQTVVDEHLKRVKVRVDEVKNRALEAAEEAGGDDAVGRSVIEEAGEDDPLNLTLRYMQASVLAIFIEPEQSPENILKNLPPDVMHYLLARIDEVLTGEAAKKRLAGPTAL